MRIAIIGAGIGGLVTAAALQRDGHAVTVLERRPQAGALGAGLSLFGNSFTALDSVGLGDIISPLTTGDAALYRAGQRTPDGRWLVTLPTSAVSSLRILHRVDLHNALASALDPGTLHSGCEASVPKDGSPTVTVTTTVDDSISDPVAGSTATFDLVVAADGIQSGTRALLGLDNPTGAAHGLRYSGYTAWRGVTDSPVDIGGTASETWGRGQRLGIAPLPDGRVYWFATDNLAENTSFDDEKVAVLDRFGSWHDPIRALLDATEVRAINRHDIHDLATPLASFVHGRTILLGDAAHAMTPDLGQGAGQAIEDAATLTRLLHGQRTDAGIDSALRDYDRIRRRRSQAIARRSRRMGTVAQWDTPFLAGLRDGVLRFTPNALIGAAASRVQTWKPPRGH